MWRWKECEVVGVDEVYEGRSPFLHGRPILRLRADPDRLLIAARLHADGTADGEEMHADDFEDLLASGEALRLSRPLEAHADATFWLLRAHFGDRERALRELQEKDALLADPHPGSGFTWLLYLDDSKASSLCEKWGERAMREASEAMSSVNRKRALDLASLAFSVFQSPCAEALAWVTLLEGWEDWPASREGILRMAGNTEGPEFRRELHEALDALERRYWNPRAEVSQVVMPRIAAARSARKWARIDLLTRQLDSHHGARP